MGLKTVPSLSRILVGHHGKLLQHVTGSGCALI